MAFQWLLKLGFFFALVPGSLFQVALVPGGCLNLGLCKMGNGWFCQRLRKLK